MGLLTIYAGPVPYGPSQLEAFFPDIAGGKASHEPGDHQRLQGVGSGHPGSEQPGGEFLSGASHLGPVKRHFSGGGLYRVGAVTVARPCPVRFLAFVAFTAEELGQLLLEGGLHHQLNGQPGHLLEVLDRAAGGAAGNCLIDLANGCAAWGILGLSRV